MGLLKELKSNEQDIRKLFGKRELVIIKKQLFGVKLSQSEKNRLSRSIRKKFEAIKILSQYSSEFSLKHGAEIKKTINETLELIAKSRYNPQIKRIILFGSTVDSTRALNSDIDIAVEFFNIDKKEATNFRLDIMKKSNEKVDVQVYNILPDKIKKEIDEKGRPLAR